MPIISLPDIQFRRSNKKKKGQNRFKSTKKAGKKKRIELKNCKMDFLESMLLGRCVCVCKAKRKGNFIRFDCNSTSHNRIAVCVIIQFIFNINIHVKCMMYKSKWMWPTQMVMKMPIVELKRCANLFHFTSQLFSIINFCICFFNDAFSFEWIVSVFCLAGSETQLWMIKWNFEYWIYMIAN